MRYLLLITVLFVEICVWGQEKVYSVPFNQNDSQWKSYKSTSERLKALQIPDDIIAIIPTSQLLEVCLEFPYFMDILFANNLQEGFVGLRDEYNGLQELMKRKDVADAIISKQKELDSRIKAVIQATDIEKGMLSAREVLLGMIAAQNEIIDNIDAKKLLELLVLSNENAKKMKLYNDIFCGINEVPLNLLYTRIVLNDKEFTSTIDSKILDDMREFSLSPVILGKGCSELVLNYINKKISTTR